MDWLEYRHHSIWLLTIRIREDTVVSSVFQLDASMPSTLDFSLLPFGFGTNCWLTSLCLLPLRHSSLDRQAFRWLKRQYRDIHPVLSASSSNLDLSVASSTSCTSAMHDITQLWGMCIIKRQRKRENHAWGWVQISVLLSHNEMHKTVKTELKPVLVPLNRILPYTMAPLKLHSSLRDLALAGLTTTDCNY